MGFLQFFKISVKPLFGFWIFFFSELNLRWVLRCLVLVFWTVDWKLCFLVSFGWRKRATKGEKEREKNNKKWFIV
jgi:hypothetical protein